MTSRLTFLKAILNGYIYFVIHEDSLRFGNFIYRWAGCCELRDVTCTLQLSCLYEQKKFYSLSDVIPLCYS